VPSSAKAQVQGKPGSLAELYSKASQLAAKEEKELGRMVNAMLPVLAWLDEPVPLEPGRFGDSLGEARSLSLRPDATVVGVDARGRESSTPLAKLRTKDCLAVMEDAFPRLNKMVVEKRRAIQVRPALSMKTRVDGSHFIVDMRTYRVLVANAGGDCKDLVVTAKLPDGSLRPCRPRDLGKGERIEIDLGVLKEVGTAQRLGLLLDCKDVDGRELAGVVPVGLDGKRWEEAALSRKQTEFRL